MFSLCQFLQFLSVMCFSGQQKPREITSFQGYQTSMWNYLFIGAAFSLHVFGQFSCLLNNLQLEIKVNEFSSPMPISLRHFQFITVQGVSCAKTPCLLFSTVSLRIIKVFTSSYKPCLERNLGTWESELWLAILPSADYLYSGSSCIFNNIVQMLVWKQKRIFPFS